ncbi:thiosulfate oxidation carrier complex protein SoxZ [Burkholderiaceae bacterium UC74_6]
MARVLITLPASAAAGQVVELRCMIAHAMETGYRVDDAGKPVPRDILRRLRVEYLGSTVFEAELFPAVAANPLIAFCLKAERSGSLRFEWSGDHGFVQVEERTLVVT